jgi:hypothetical protein
MRRAICNVTMSVALCAGLLGVFAAPAAAQDPKVAVTGGVDFSNRYSFRGIRQNIGEVSIWPFVDVGIPLSSGDGALKSVTLNLGTWNAFHSEIDEASFVDRDGDPTSNKWYESDLYATLGLGFGTTTLGFTYTSYMSPANLWHNVQELAVKVSFDDSGALGKGALKPYGLVAFELGDGGADGVSKKGTYVELGIAPGYSADKASIAFPIKVGLSAKDYYEFGGEDGKFGYFSVAGIATVPINSNWNVHGGAELQVYGDKLRSFNAYGDSLDRRYTGIVSIGIGFSY